MRSSCIDAPTGAGRTGSSGWGALSRTSRAASPALKSIRAPRSATVCFLTTPWAWWWARRPRSATAARFTRASRWAVPPFTKAPSGTRRWAAMWWWARARRCWAASQSGTVRASARTRWSSNPCRPAPRRWATRRASSRPKPTSSVKRPPARWVFQPMA